MNKQETLTALQESRAALLQAIEGLSPEEMQAPGVAGEWSIKDILAHISRVEADLIGILFQIQQGQRPKIPNLTAADVDLQNAQFVQESKGRTLQQEMTDFLAVRKQTIRRVEEFKDNDLSDPHRYPFLQGNSLSEFIAGDTYEHDAEHTQEILAWRQVRENPKKAL